jgi:hypothetical protein
VRPPARTITGGGVNAHDRPDQDQREQAESGDELGEEFGSLCNLQALFQAS